MIVRALFLLIMLCCAAVYFAPSVSADDDLPWLNEGQAQGSTSIIVVIAFADGLEVDIDNDKAISQVLDFLNADNNNRVQIDAYAQIDGGVASNARKISLKRAIAVRKKLLSNGVNRERIVVRALGGKTSENKNRIDILKL